MMPPAPGVMDIFCPDAEFMISPTPGWLVRTFKATVPDTFNNPVEEVKLREDDALAVDESTANNKLPGAYEPAEEVTIPPPPPPPEQAPFVLVSVPVAESVAAVKQFPLPLVVEPP